MDSRNRKSDASLDNILKELKEKEKSMSAGGGNSGQIDDILADIGIETRRKAPLYDPDSPDFRMRRETNQPLSQAEKVAQSTAVFQAISKEQIEQSRAEARQQPARPAKPASPRQQATQQSPVRQAPAPAPASEEPFQEKPAPKKDLGKTTIWDVKVERSDEPEPPRVGKAAALDRVDRDKFSRDEELLSWFSAPEPEEEPVNKKEQRRLLKEEKRQQAAARKAEREEQKATVELFRLEEDPENEGMYLPSPNFGVQEEEMEPAKERAGLFKKGRMRQDDVVTGSAFDDSLAEGEWPEGGESLFDTGVFPAQQAAPHPNKEEPETVTNTQSYEITQEDGAYHRVPTAAFTQEFDKDGAEPAQGEEETRSLFVDERVDDRFKEFFAETVIVEREDLERGRAAKAKTKKEKRRKTPLLTGEFSKLAQAAEEYPADEPDQDAEFSDYNNLQDAGIIENDLAALKKTLVVRTLATTGVSLLLFWLAFGLQGSAPLPAFISPLLKPMLFGLVYLVLLLAAVVINFTTIAAGLNGLGREPSSDSAPAIAAVGTLLQSVVLLVQLVSGGSLEITLFGGAAALLLAANAFGKWVRARSILDNFRLASAEFNHSAAYVLDESNDLSYNITRGLREDMPTVLVSRPTNLVKGFMRQSFSLRWSDRLGRVLGWVLLAVGLFAGMVSFAKDKQLYLAVSSFAAALCFGAPLSSTLLSGVPAALLQKGSAKVGAVVPGWSAIEELGQVNVVMAGARDLFPPSSVRLNGIKTFEKERIDHALLYAASVLIAGCDTLKDIFMGVIQGKSDMLYKVESLTYEPGRGFTAWVKNNRVVVGTREMMRRHDVDPPSIEVEMNSVPEGSVPVYLAVGGRLSAMFIVGYNSDEEVADTLDGLVRSGVSLLVTSQDMNITKDLIERVYHLPADTVKVLGERELSMMEPLTNYESESEGVMTHIGSFASFIGGMRAAAGCAAAERMSGILQAAAVGLASVLCILLAVSGGLSGLSLLPLLIYQLAWTLMVVAVPFVRRY